MAKRREKEGSAKPSLPASRALGGSTDKGGPHPVVTQSIAPSSLEFSRDAKGQPRWAIKCYGETEDMDAIVDRVLALDMRLRKETR